MPLSLESKSLMQSVPTYTVRPENLDTGYSVLASPVPGQCAEEWRSVAGSLSFSTCCSWPHPSPDHTPHCHGYHHPHLWVYRTLQTPHCTSQCPRDHCLVPRGLATAPQPAGDSTPDHLYNIRSLVTAAILWRSSWPPALLHPCFLHQWTAHVSGYSIHSPIFLFLLELLLLAVVLFLPDLPRFVWGQVVEGESTGVLLASAD